MKSSLKLLLTFIAVMFFTGCGMNDYNKITGNTSNSLDVVETYTETTTEIENPVAGGSLNISMRPPKTLNPLINEDVTVDNVLKLVFEPLFTLNNEQRVVPNLAEKYSISEDGLNVYVKLKDDLTWHDGTRITARDVVFSLDTIKSAPETTLYKNALQGISKYYAHDSKTVVITYSEPCGVYIYNLCFPVIPMDYYRNKLSIESEESLNPIGSGSYKFVSYQIVRKAVLEKYQGFKGTPYIDNINIIITSDRETDLYSFEQGVTDVITADIGEWGKYSSSRNSSATEFTTTDFEFIGFNFNNQILINPNLRQAVAYSIPMDDILETVYLGHAVKALTPIVPSSWFYNEEFNTKYNYDLRKAREIIQGTGLTKEQLTFSILINEENKERLEIAQFVADSLNQIGMNVSINSQPFDVYQQMLNENNFDLFVGGVLLSNKPDLISMFLSSSQALPGINYFNYSSQTMDSLLNSVVNAVGDANFKNAMFELQKYMSSELPCIGIAFKSSAVLTSSKVKGEKLPVLNNAFNNIEKWYITE